MNDIQNRIVGLFKAIFLFRNVDCGEKTSRLRGIERRAARTVNAERTCAFAHRIEIFKGNTLSAILHGKTAVAMLCADRDLQTLTVKVDTVGSVKVDGRTVHFFESFDRCGKKRIRIFQIFLCLFRELFDTQNAVMICLRGISSVIQKNASALLFFAENGKVYTGRATAYRLFRIKRPFIALGEDRVEHFFVTCKRLAEEFSFVLSVFIRGNITGQNLLIRARKIPAEIHGSKTVLGFRQIRSICACRKCRAKRAGLARRIYGIRIDRGGTAHGVNDSTCGEQAKTERIFLADLQGTERKKALDFSVFRQNTDHAVAVKNGNALRHDRLLQRLGHIFRRQRTAGGRSRRLIVVGLVANVFSEFVHRKRNPEPDELEEASCRQSGIGQRKITVHGATAHKRLCHIVNAVLHAARKIELVVRLFIRARVAGGAHHSALRDDENVRHAERIERIRRVIACRPTSDDRGRGCEMRYLPTADRNKVHKKSFPKHVLP